MTTSTEDLDSFTNSLSAELGSDTAVILSTQGEDRQFIGAEALATFGVYLFGIFVSAFLESLKDRLKSEVTVAGKTLAEALIDRVKSAVTRVKSAVTELRKPGQTSEPNRRQALSDVDEALREVAAYPEAAAGLEAAERAGQAKIAAELKELGMPDAEAQKKAERLMLMIVSRSKPA